MKLRSWPGRVCSLWITHPRLPGEWHSVASWLANSEPAMQVDARGRPLAGMQRPHSVCTSTHRHAARSPHAVVKVSIAQSTAASQTGSPAGNGVAVGLQPSSFSASVPKTRRLSSAEAQGREAALFDVCFMFLVQHYSSMHRTEAWAARGPARAPVTPQKSGCTPAASRAAHTRLVELSYTTKAKEPCRGEGGREQG